LVKTKETVILMEKKDSYDIILAGVGGQGVLSVAAVISLTAIKEGFKIRQSEVHGMSQRGGAVVAHMRISKYTIESDLIPLGSADIVLSMEPLESLRYVEYLKPDGKLITASKPYLNIPDYPEINDILEKVIALPQGTVIEAEKLAKQAGSTRAVNMVLVGALTKELPFRDENIKKAVEELFLRKGKKIVEINLRAIELGETAAGE